MSATDLSTLHEQLKHEWCDAFTVNMLAGGAISIGTPFTFGDGDTYPVIVERVRGGWRITDHGYVVSHFQHDEFGVTDARARQIERFANANGVTVEGSVLSRTIERPPQVEDITDFLEVVARVSGLPLHSRVEPESDLFKTRARLRVDNWLDGVSREPTSNWEPDEVREKGSFVADMRIETPLRPVVAFFVGSQPKAVSSIMSIFQYRKLNYELTNVFAYNVNLTGHTKYQAEEAIDGRGELVRVDERLTDTGYIGLHRVFEEAGVEMTPGVV